MTRQEFETIYNDLKNISRQYKIKFITTPQRYDSHDYSGCFYTNPNNSIVVIDYLSKL